MWFSPLPWSRALPRNLHPYCPLRKTYLSISSIIDGLFKTFGQQNCSGTSLSSPMRLMRLTSTILTPKQTGSNSITECKWINHPFLCQTCFLSCWTFSSLAYMKGPWALRWRRRGPPWAPWRSRGAVRHAVGRSVYKRYLWSRKNPKNVDVFQIKVSRFLQCWVAYWEWSWARLGNCFL